MSTVKIIRELQCCYLEPQNFMIILEFPSYSVLNLINLFISEDNRTTCALK